VNATTARIEKVVTAGTFALDGGEWQVENNVWLVGDDREVLVVDAAHDAEKILAAVGDRRVVAVVCTHGHNDHVNAAVEVAAATDAVIALHPADRMLWAMEYGEDLHPDIDLGEADPFTVAGTTLAVLHTPGHTPGSVCLYAPDLGVVFSGDTLFQGGPGATGRSYSDFREIIDSIRDRVLTLPPATDVHTGHGSDTTIGRESPHLEEWIARGH
jgi:glyoxylase-like metal-dependent hydrolase (beta-lactamase superfamily II)